MMEHNWFLAGNRGLVGTNFRELCNCIDGVNTENCNLESYEETLAALSKPNYSNLGAVSHVMINAATVGGLMDDINNSFDLYIKNLTIQNNVFRACKQLEIKNVLLQGSTCAFPAVGTGSGTYIEDDLFKGKPHETYLPTALPKLVGYQQCIAANTQFGYNWKTAILTNLFGPWDKVGEVSHAIGALMQKFVKSRFHHTNSIEVWGSGNQERDFLYVKDAIMAFDLIMDSSYDAVNVASGITTSISEIIDILIKVSNYKGNIIYDTSKPEGILKRSVSNKRLLNLGWEPMYTLEDALAETYKWYWMHKHMFILL